MSYLGSPEKAGRRFLFYILGIAVLAGLAALLAPRYWKTPYNQSEFYLSGLLQPVFVGILALWCCTWVNYAAWAGFKSDWLPCCFWF